MPWANIIPACKESAKERVEQCLLFQCRYAYAPVNWNPHPLGPGEGSGIIGALNHFWTANCPLGVVHLTDFDFGFRPHVGPRSREISYGASKDGGVF